jgi:glyoxylase-like metal-dependent hydrolase (beta-lactamase superfamily II)
MEINHSFWFKLGQYDCLSVSDGVFPVPDMLPGKSLSQYDSSPGQMVEVICLLIKTDKHTVLIDTGFGLMGQPGAGKLIQNLQTEGILCSEIDKIIVTHMHPDHIGGNTDAECRSVFPNARYFVNRKEWEYWTSNPDLTRYGQIVQQNFLETIQKRLWPVQGQVDLFEETEIMPGIEIIQAPGHSPGHIVIVVSSGRDRLLCTCDLFHDPKELGGPDLEMVGDSMPKQASLTRIHILSQFVTPETMIFACHFPFPGLGYILKKGNAWYWQPVNK